MGKRKVIDIRRVYRFFSLILILLMVSCSNDTAQENENTGSKAILNSEPVTFVHNKHEFKVVYYFAEFLNYIEKAEQEPGNLDELYIESVLNPFSKDVFGEYYGETLSSNWGLGTPTNTEILKRYNEALLEDQDKINSLIVEALKKSVNELPPGTDKTVYVFPANPKNASVMKWIKGVSGLTWNKDFFLIQIAPSFLNEDMLKLAVAHEYHHSVLFEDKDNYNNTTVLGEVLLEGRADKFSRILYPEIEPPWSHFSPSQEEATWNLLNENIDSTDYSIIDDLFNGVRSKGIPDRSNYKIGYAIMTNFIQKNPDITILEWSKMSPIEILEKSNYEEKKFDK
ncbi:DUF2268 domain-containing protein [Aquibacillus rhizosphaerae]|uniref:DUF2268 domain-containing putative Zn-dependent protease n=1 Tax=Aquibacillus rhizosphaerae TaxID=3051431 RepID=A0ABT7L108_9BACI|nr:DUF2268 domain-containing putative Zn-dependent protease [Aquibacillus sp. LR5S19]MDL4839477.1 DUF2268 domain-containing putative Zn-dependent protease [Aquibacillus sp. LR5S19]